MVDKQRIAEIDKAISDTRAELAAIRQEKATAEADNDPERLVLAEKQERRKVEALAALERTMTAATYKPPEPTDCAEFLFALYDYMDEKAEKEAKAAAAVDAAKREAQEIEQALQQAAADCDPEKTVELSGKREEVKSKLKYLTEMQQRVHGLPTFPPDAFTNTWATICEKVLPEWERRILQAETLAEEYKTVCAGLIEMHDRLKSVRDEIERMAAREGCPALFTPVFTEKIDTDKLKIEKNAYDRLFLSKRPFSGTAL